MKTVLSNILIFTGGAAVGSLVTWKLLKKKYEQLANEQIANVVDRFAQMTAKSDQETDDGQLSMDFSPEVVVDEEEFVPTEEELKQYEEYAGKYQSHSGNKPEEEVKAMDGPYVIPPDLFGENPDYETVSLTYYADGVLTDDWDNVIDDAEDLLGAGSLSTFGQYEDDSVFVRDDAIKTDYEILADEREFADVKRKKPSTLGGE